MKRKIFLALFIIAALSSVIALAILNYPYSSGSRSGRLVKLSKKGWVLKTYEGTLDLGSGDNLTWDFSIRNESVALEMAKKIGERVTVQYKELLTPLIYETKYNIVSFEVDMVMTPEAKAILCRFVDVLRNYPQTVDAIRPILEKDDPDLLKAIRRECQHLAN